MRKKRRTFQDYLQEHLEDPDFKKQWEAGEPAFQIAQQVIGYRVQNGLTQKQLAEKVGTSQSAIARIESFEYGRLTLSTLQRIANALNLDLKIQFLEKAS